MKDLQEFEAAEIAQDFRRVTDGYFELAGEIDEERVDTIEAELKEELKEHREDDVLTVAFVGQYSAGKSTIISALTGRDDIEIDTDIATDEVSEYEWDGIRLIDTPGLYTEREDHDEMAYDAIERADLLVFTVTYMLFDDLTAENFKHLAYERGYKDKMMLVVNKLADEASDPEQRIPNYRESLQDAIDPHDLDDIEVCFMDALDYIHGVEEGDDYLIEESRFESFITSLNKFVSDRGTLGHLDTPVRLLLGAISDTQDLVLQEENDDDEFVEIIRRLSRETRNERKRFNLKVDQSAMELRASVSDLGTDVAQKVGKLDEEEIEREFKEAEHDIEQYAHETTKEFQNHLEEASERLHEGIAEILTDDIVESYVADIDVDTSVSAENPDDRNEWSDRKEKFEELKELGEQVGVRLARAGGQGVGGLLKAGAVKGDDLHQAVYKIGKLLGVNFKPYQAVRLAGYVGKAVKFAGPALGVVGAALDFKEAMEDDEQAKKIREARGEVVSEFNKIGRELEKQFKSERQKAEAKVFDPVQEEIQKERKKVRERSKEESELGSRLDELENEARSLLNDIREQV